MSGCVHLNFKVLQFLHSLTSAVCLEKHLEELELCKCEIVKIEADNKLPHYESFDTSKANNMNCAVMFNILVFSVYLDKVGYL